LSRQNQLSSTVSLLCILFEDLGCAIKLHEECADNVTEKHSLDPRKYLFNGQEERDDSNYFLFGQDIINDFNGAEKEYLELYESWCLFAYREFYKNLLAILVEFSLRKEKTNIPTRFCEFFDLDIDERIHAYLMKLSNNISSDPGISYEAVMNSQRYIIRSGITCPYQLSLGNISTMSSITDSIGEGWDIRRVSKYFNEENNSANQQQEAPMTTSKYYGKAHILFFNNEKNETNNDKREWKVIHH
jgi:hypothetical protein